jgi:hypothetical protein
LAPLARQVAGKVAHRGFRSQYLDIDHRLQDDRRTSISRLSK